MPNHIAALSSDTGQRDWARIGRIATAAHSAIAAAGKLRLNRAKRPSPSAPHTSRMPAMATNGPERAIGRSWRIDLAASAWMTTPGMVP